MNICLLGHTGFIGCAVFSALQDIGNITAINSNSPDSIFENQSFDVVVNCAGNSKKFLANQSPSLACKIEFDILRKLEKIKADRIIHLSSGCHVGLYGQIKLLMEKCISQLYPQCIILQPSGLVGPNLRKNSIYDLMHGNKLYITSDSVLNFISTAAVGELIKQLILSNTPNCTIPVAALEPITVKEIIKLFGKDDVEYGSVKEDAGDLDVSMAASLINLKTSKDYVIQFLEKSLKIY